MLLTKEITSLLNQQLVHEGKNHLKYMAIASYFSKCNLVGFEKLFLKQAKGEREHYDKIYSYLSDKNADISIESIQGANVKGTDCLSTCKSIGKQFLDIEISTTQALYDIVESAQSEKDYGTVQFLYDFLILEQVEEEALAYNTKAELDRCITLGDLNNMDGRLNA